MQENIGKEKDHTYNIVTVIQNLRLQNVNPVVLVLYVIR